MARTWQSTELFDDLDVAENLTVAASAAGAPCDPGETLDLLGMEWAAAAMPAGLSSGQRKLVGVARALAAKPKLLCLDEPAVGLDTAESTELGNRLRALADEGQSMLLIERDMSLVLGICDRVVVLEFGQVIADGPPGRVRRDAWRGHGFAGRLTRAVAAGIVKRGDTPFLHAVATNTNERRDGPQTRRLKAGIPCRP